MILGTSKRCFTFPFENEFRILGCVMTRQGKTCDAVEERMQTANKAFWKDIQIYKSKDVPWRIKCQRLVDHVCAVFSFGSETWSWTQQTSEKIKKVGNNKNGVQMNLPFLCENIAESMRRPMVWVCDEKTDAVIGDVRHSGNPYIQE